MGSPPKSSWLAHLPGTHPPTKWVLLVLTHGTWPAPSSPGVLALPLHFPGHPPATHILGLSLRCSPSLGRSQQEMITGTSRVPDLDWVLGIWERTGFPGPCEDPPAAYTAEGSLLAARRLEAQDPGAAGLPPPTAKRQSLLRALWASLGVGGPSLALVCLPVGIWLPLCRPSPCAASRLQPTEVKTAVSLGAHRLP